jgi:hypothetical protein
MHNTIESTINLVTSIKSHFISIQQAVPFSITCKGKLDLGEINISLFVFLPSFQEIHNSKQSRILAKLKVIQYYESRY